MQTKLRPHATAGIALVGASLIALTPVTAPSTDVRVASPPVNLSAAIDPITPWQNVFDKAKVNFEALNTLWTTTPAPVLQQVIVNQMGYLNQLPDFETIFAEMQANLDAAMKAATAKDLATLNALQRLAFQLLPSQIPGGLPPEAKPIVDFLTSYLSGALIGLVGPVVGPALVVGYGIQAIAENLTSEAPDPEAALNTLLNMPAAMSDAFLNGGQKLDFTPLLTALDVAMPANTTIGITFGGVLSPGGSLFKSLNMGLGGFKIAGTGVGTIGSLMGMSKVIAKAIGWDGTGNPLDPPAGTTMLRSGGDDPAQVPALKENNAATYSVTLNLNDSRSGTTVGDVGAGETDGLAADAPSESKDEAAQSKPRVKRYDAGHRLKKAIESEGEQLKAAVPKLGKHVKRHKAAAATSAAENNPSDSHPSRKDKSESAA
ncbi:outer membrane porin GjpA [Mycolicibacterium senegalense]|uniref:outer membrane porin GjpA n=1 Tax=Mycolicibacterium TaxID=1866885 RepID=UPI003204DB77